MSENETTRLGGPGGSKGHRGGRGPISPSIISAPDTTSPSQFVGSAIDRDRRALIDVALAGLALLPVDRLRAVARRWAAALDVEIRGRS
jgi:hypothetical protein